MAEAGSGRLMRLLFASIGASAGLLLGQLTPGTPEAGAQTGPTVTGISPSDGSPNGGTLVTITGSGFVSSSVVYFGGQLATGYACGTATSCTATAPPGTGTVDVTVLSDGAASPVTSSDRFTYDTPPISSTPVPGAASNSWISCPVRGWCGAGGETRSGGTLETGTDGDWAPVPAPFPQGVSTYPGGSSGDVSGVACPSAGSCIGVGDYLDANDKTHPVLYRFLNGAWTSSPVAVAFQGETGARLDYVTCASPSFCVAAGIYADTSSDAHTFFISIEGNSMTVAAAPDPPNAVGDDPYRRVQALSCPVDGWCVASILYSDSAVNQHNALVNLSNGTWSLMSPALPPSGDTADMISGLSCPAAGYCTLIGDYGGSSGSGEFVETYASGTWSSNSVPLAPDAPSGAVLGRPWSISCATSNWCVAQVQYQYQSANVSGQSANVNAIEAVTLSDGALSATTIAQPGAPQPGAADSTTFNYPGPIACPAVGDCTTTAQESYTTNALSTWDLALSLYGGTWTQSAYTNGTGLVDLSCPQPAWCALGGTSGGSGSSAINYLQVGGKATDIAVSSSANPGTPGSELTFTARVTPAPDGGTVAFADLGNPIPGCTYVPVDGSTGDAECRVTYSTTGSHSVTASYFGDSAFAETGPSPTLTENVTPPCPTGVNHQALFDDPWAVAAMTAVINGRTCAGYWIVTRSGGVTSVGAATWYGDHSDTRLNARMIGIAATPTGKGYYLLAADGGIFTYGDAQFRGSTGSKALNAPIVAMAVTRSGRGYWLAASDGGIFAFGDASFLGSMGSKRLNQPVVGMSADAQTGGYWMVAADGGIFSFSAPYYGSTGSKHLNQPVVGMTPQPDGTGYRLVAGDGGVFDFGSAAFYGSLPGEGVQNPQVTTMAPSADGNGYYLINAAGTIWAFGDAAYLGNA